MLHSNDPMVLVRNEKIGKLALRANSFLTGKHARPPTTAKELLEYGGISAVIEFGCSQAMGHDFIRGCHRCDIVAEYYLAALQWATQDEEINCTAELLELVWQMTHLLLEHREIPLYQEKTWFTSTAKALWEFAKRLKYESDECDLYLPSLAGKNICDPYLSDHQSGDSFEEQDYRRAMRITIYHCRAILFQQKNELDKAAVYYRKCLAVRPPESSETHILLRESALVSLRYLIGQSERPIMSRTSTLSSTSSVSPVCTNCGIEKKKMPVCAKCKSTAYCSMRCLVAHKQAHQSQCVKH